MKSKKEVFSYKKGQILHLDDIYTIQGLCDSDWWENFDIDGCGDNIYITRNIKITITES